MIKNFIKQLDLLTVDHMDFSKSRSDTNYIEERLNKDDPYLFFPKRSLVAQREYALLN